MSPARHSWLAAVERWPLATRLAVSMLVVAAVAITGLFFVLNEANRADVERLQTTALANSARDLGRQLDVLVANELSRAANLALSRAAQEFVSVRADQRAPLFTPTLADFTNFMRSNQPFYRAVLLLDQRGEVLIATDGGTVGRSFAGYGFFQAALGGSTYMSDPGVSPIDRLPVIWLAAPVYKQAAEPGARPAGVLTIALAPQELWEAVRQVQIGVGGYAVLVDRYGIRLAHGRDPRYVFRSLAPLPPDAWAALQREGRFAGMAPLADTGSAELLGYIRSDPLPSIFVGRPGAGVADVYYSATRLRERDWTVVAMLPASEVQAPVANTTLRGVMAVVLVVLLLGLLVSWMARRLVRPVPLLAQAAARIAAGDLVVPIAVRGSSELAALADNFEMMRQRLAHARDELAGWASTLERRVARRTQELAALSEVVALASRQQSRTQMLQTALDRALLVVGTQIGGIWLADAAGALRLAAGAGFGPDLAEGLDEFAPGEGLLGAVQRAGESLVIEDISQSPRLARAVVKDAELHGFVAVPLRVAERTLGVLGMFSHERQRFSPDAVGLVTSIGQQIALTLDNIALVAQLQEQARAVAALTERERLAGEIHDGIAQNLSYLYLQIDQIAGEVAGSHPAQTQQRLAQLQAVLDITTGEVRELIARLQDATLPSVRLGQQLQSELARMGGELALQVAIRVGPPGDVLVPADVGAELGRIVGEALRNAQRHGRAAQAQIEVQRCEGHGFVSIRDDGAGFEPGAPRPDARGHYGLMVMRARAARIGGTLAIKSRPGAGACIEVIWPVDDAVRSEL